MGTPQDPGQARSTSATLLKRLRAGNDASAWREFELAYRELLLRFVLSRGFQHADAEDVVQAVFTKLVRGLGRFEYDRSKGRFRDYLYRCARSAISDATSRPNPAAPGVSDSAIAWVADERDDQEAFEREWVDHHYRRAAAHVRASAEPRTIAVLDAVLAGTPPAVIAKELGMSEDAVYKAFQRVRDRLRAQIARQVREEDDDA